MKRILLGSLFALFVSGSLLGQGFINLDFESAKLVFITTNLAGSGTIAVSNALPGWSLVYGTTQQSTIAYNNFTGLPTQLLGSNSDVILGNFDVLLNPNWSISQTGLVPTGTESLLFASSPNPSVLVSLDNVNLPYTAILKGTNSYGRIFNVYAADVSAFAGQIETLTFSGYALFDDIQFSSTSVPEPSSFELLALGGGVLFHFRRRRGFWR